MPAICPDCACAGVDTGTTQESTTAGAAAASARLARLPTPVANAGNHLDVAVGVDTHLDLYGADALGDNLRGLVLGLPEAHKTDRMSDRNATPDRAPQKPMHRKTALLAGEIVGCKFDGCFGVGEAFDGMVHPRMQLHDLSRRAAFARRRQMPPDPLDGRSGGLAKVSAGSA